MVELAYLNGEVVPLSEAKVSVNDRGFLFGDGVYEVIRSYGGHLWLLERHLERLSYSLSRIKLQGVEIGELREKIEMVHKRSGIEDATIYLQVTRGAAPRDHAFPHGVPPTVLITVEPCEPLPESLYLGGVKVITTPEIRWQRRDIKSVNLLPNVLAKQRAKCAGAFEALFVDENGYVTEGSSHNVFCVRDNKVYTTPTGTHILAGITRGFILEIARREGVEVHEQLMSLRSLLRADEVFLTGTRTEVLGVVAVDEQQIGEGHVGGLTKRLHGWYRQAIEQRVSD